MAQAEKEQSVDRIDLLFDEERLSALHQQYNTASGIKANVSTSAATYEIRSALAYWYGVDTAHNHRISRRVIDQCEAVENGVDPEQFRGDYE